MGFVTKGGLHEGYLVPQFVDGQLGTGTTGGSIPDGQIATGPGVRADDGTLAYPSRPAGEVTGWVVCCDCSEPGEWYSSRATTWTGPVFTRVPSRALQDLEQRRIYAVDEDVAYVGDREDVSAVVAALWHSEHVDGASAIAGVTAAARVMADAKRHLDEAVADARRHGVSWAKIGQAVGITRQSAQERWGDLLEPR